MHLKLKTYEVGHPGNIRLVQAPTALSAVAFYEHELAGEVSLVMPVWKVNGKRWRFFPFWFVAMFTETPLRWRMKAMWFIDHCQFVERQPMSLAEMREFPQNLIHTDRIQAWIDQNPMARIITITELHHLHTERHAKSFNEDEHAANLISIFVDPSGLNLYMVESINDASVGQPATRNLLFLTFEDVLEHPKLAAAILKYEKAQDRVACVA